MNDPADASSSAAETVPPDRWRVDEQLVAGGDFGREADAMFRRIELRAVVALDVGLDAAGRFVDARSGRPLPDDVAAYSRMKHGDLDAVASFAGRLAAVAIRTDRFLGLLRDAVSHGRVVFMTTAAVFNVPSASNLLLRATAARINVVAARRGLAPVVVVEPTRLSDSPLGYASAVVRERRDGRAAGRGVTIVPEFFRGQSVVFLDDLFSTGFTAHRAEARLRRVGVADRFYLFAVRIEPASVEASSGQVEDLLNDAFVTDGPARLVPLLRGGNVAVVQKLVKLVLDPDHAAGLPAFLDQLPTAPIVEIYAAAAADGFRHRHQGRYLPSLLVVERVLEDRGALDGDGQLVHPPVHPLADLPNRASTFRRLP